MIIVYNIFRHKTILEISDFGDFEPYNPYKNKLYCHNEFFDKPIYLVT